MTGNMYWAGAFPGLLLATTVSIGLAWGLARPGLKHILWLVPLLHFAFALGVGPAISLVYGLFVIPLAGWWASWLWIIGSLVLFGAMVAARTSRPLGARRGPWAATAAACLLVIGLFVPPFYYLIAG
jgi:hypothetical protein